MADLIARVLDSVQIAAESLPAASFELATGLESLDLAIGGLRAGDLAVLGGGAASGKSSLALNFVRHISVEANCPSVVISMQAKGEHVLERLASALSGIPLRRLISGRLSDDDWLQLVDAVGRLASVPILVSDQPEADLGAIESAVNRSVENFGRCALMVVDHSRLLKVNPHPNEDWAPTLRALGRELKVLARRHDCAVLLVEPSDDSGHLRECFPDADVIMALGRTGRSVGVGDLDPCELRILKQQNGPSCAVRLQFSAATSRFRSD